MNFYEVDIALVEWLREFRARAERAGMLALARQREAAPADPDLKEAETARLAQPRSPARAES